MRRGGNAAAAVALPADVVSSWIVLSPMSALVTRAGTCYRVVRDLPGQDAWAACHAGVGQRTSPPPGTPTGAARPPARCCRRRRRSAADATRRLVAVDLQLAGMPPRLAAAGSPRSVRRWP